MKSFRQFLEQITQQDYEAAQSAAENSPAKRLQRIREREAERRKKHRDEVEEIARVRRELLDKQREELEQRRQQREQERQERANRRSGTEED